VGTTNPAKFAAFAGDDGWTDVRVYDEREAPILSFGIGKGGADGSWSNVYLRVDDLQKGGLGGAVEAGAQRPGKVVASTGLDAWGNRGEPTFWVETRLFPGLSEADLTEVAWEHAPKSWSGRLVRGTKAAGAEGDDPWTLSGTHSGAAKPATAKLYAQAFVGLPLAGLEDGKETPETDAKYGFDKPDLVLTARGRAAGEGSLAPEWKVVVGKKAEGKAVWYARRSGPAGREPWVFAVNDYDLSRFRDDPKDLLETPPAPPPAEPGMGEAPTEPAMGEAPPAPPAEPTPPAMGETPPPPPAEPAMGEAPPAPAAPGEAPKEPAPPSDPPMGETPPPAPAEGPAK
jgi:hypothetical protein